MKRVLLVNKERIPHYRVPVYNYLADYLQEGDFFLTVVAEGIQDNNPFKIQFNHVESRLSFWSLVQLFRLTKPDIIIFWTNPEINLFSFIVFAKLMHAKIIHWGHRRDQQHPHAFFRNLVYDLEHIMDDAIILYAEHLRKQMRPSFRSRIFVANNTLNLRNCSFHLQDKAALKEKHGIKTGKTIICMGRIQRRKRIEDLVEAFYMLDMSDVGLIIAGPDPEGLLRSVDGESIYKPGAVYGTASLELLSASDIYCLPGAMGLSIVDAMFCGLPVVTERVNHGPEIMYLKDGINGFVVDKGDTGQLSARLRLLLTDDELREQFSRAAKQEIMTNGDINRMCEGFIAALRYVCNK